MDASRYRLLGGDSCLAHCLRWSFRPGNRGRSSVRRHHVQAVAYGAADNWLLADVFRAVVRRDLQSFHCPRLDLSDHHRRLLADHYDPLETNSRRAAKFFSMMSPGNALHDPVFRTYLLIVPALISCGGVILAILQYGFRKQLDGIWDTWRSWIVMAAIGLLFVFAGRVATITGVTLLSILAFKEFASTSRLDHDRWMTGVVYAGIIMVGLVSILYGLPGQEIDSGWYSLFLVLPAFIIPLIVLVPI